MKTIGVIGLGIIGGAWAHRYSVAGQLVGTWNRSPKPSAPAWKTSPAEVAAAADVTQIVVADPAAVELVLKAIVPALGPGKYVVQSSTIDPESSARFQAMVQATGAHYVECPFTGSKPAAEEGKTVYFMGGAPADIDAVLPLLRLVSEVQFTIGTGEQAAAIKLAMNLNLAVQMEALSESLTFARKAGISDETYFDVLAKNAGYSPLAKMKELKLRAGNYDPQFSVKHMHKDMRLASATAGCADYPLLEAVRERLKLAEARGMGDADYCALIRLLQQAD
ncbi:2-(hydroxymethyl)glutarate dehydrogenase [mine drainage metagenome]|uniref:2-(Hydroxymethyl)glutarate dehydrogenase n=1 Tax=mine drainage metagenome TaxID=410659 RepID=A0A1J5T2B5_9ZZZZ